MNSIHAKPYGSAVLESEIVALRVENARLREALRPFAKAGELFDGEYAKLGWDMLIYGPCAGREYHIVGNDLIAARVALSGDKQPS